MLDTRPGIGDRLQSGAIISNYVRDRPLGSVPFCFYVAFISWATSFYDYYSY